MKSIALGFLGAANISAFLLACSVACGLVHVNAGTCEDCGDFFVEMGFDR